MTLYRVGFRQTQLHTAVIEAASEREAKAKVLDGDYYDSSFDLVEDTEITFVFEEGS